METSGGLFNPGFLGSSFLWWVGQIADDSTWRDNINSGNYEDKYSIPGWGKRYKVRIIGLHDQGETEIPSDQLPWANIMYPVTAGGFQTNSGQSPNLRQGNMVFGFFLDGQDQQVPVIMGVLGNNSQTELSQIIGDNSVTNAQAGSIAKSGYASGSKSKGNAREIVPDQDKVIKQPARTGQEDAAVQAALAQEAGPGAKPAPGATLENEAVHQITAGDVKRSDKCDEKIALMKPDPEEVVQSALKGIQTVIENLTAKIDKYLQAIQSYVDAVSSTVNDLEKVIKDAADEMSKYMKVIFDKIMEYAIKIFNKGMNSVVAALPSSLRYQFSDMKETLTELILCLYNKLMDGMSDKIAGALTDAINPSQLEKDANDRANNGVDDKGKTLDDQTNPQVPVCYSEDIVSVVLVDSKQEIDDANNNVLDNMNAYLEDISSMLAGVSGALSDVNNLIPDISGGMASALSFTNIKLNIFGCELSPNVATSDFYTFCSGGDGAPPGQLPSEPAVAKNLDSATAAPSLQPVPYVEPTRDTPTVVHDKPISAAESDPDKASQDSKNNVPVDPNAPDIQ
tara:strand:- start:937 stop:2637 length:1701 start_codon:yes stop_codon:yes gene_type:complete